MAVKLPSIIHVPFGDQTACFDRDVHLRIVQETGDPAPLKAYVKRRGYAPRPYVRIQGRGVPAARRVLDLAPGDPRHVHHINGRISDNRRCNLIALAPSEHGHQHRRRGRSGYRAVYPMASGGYRARFRGIHVGCYPTARVAALAYDLLAAHFMRRPRLNVPEGGTPDEMRLVRRGLGPVADLWLRLPREWRPPWLKTPPHGGVHRPRRPRIWCPPQPTEQTGGPNLAG